MLPVLLLVFLIAAIGLALLGAYILYRGRDRADAPKETAVASPALTRSFRSSLATLRSKVAGRDYKYRVPVVLAVGAPCSGKSTLLDQLATHSTGEGSEAAWRFLSGGAVIDVPGSFLISTDGRAATDGQWKKLLRLLVRHRGHRPLDGIVLFIPAPELLAEGEVNDLLRKGQAAAIREKLDQLQTESGMVAPIYVLLTKCDHVRGFADFHQRINTDLDDDLFGWSNGSTLESAFSPDWVDEAFQSVGDRLIELELTLLSRASAAPTDDFFLFPVELERMRLPLRAYLSQIFRETSYVDPNFLRGIYFAGDATGYQPRVGASVVPNAATNAAPESASGSNGVKPPLALVRPLELTPLHSYRPQIAFARQLFDLKVFPEARIARAVRGFSFSRDRASLAAKAALALFVVVFAAGTTLAYFRLSDLHDRRFTNLLDLLSARVSQAGGDETKTHSVAGAYDLVDTLGVLDAEGFRSFFLPASWRDPINSAVASALAGSFSQIVLPAFAAGLDAKAQEQAGPCAAVPPVEQTLPTDVEALAQIRFDNDPEYQQLARSLADYDALRRAIREYDEMRTAGRGRFADLDGLFRYLLNRSLDDESRFQHNRYYIRAIEDASGRPIHLASSGELDRCMGVRTLSRIDNFYGSWFDKNNPLPALAGGVADEIGDLQTGAGQTRDKLQFLVDDVRRLDALISGGSYSWLHAADFNAADFPALSKSLQPEPFAGLEFLQTVNTRGSAAFAKLKSEVFSVNADATGLILTLGPADMKVSSTVSALASTLDALLSQDFMAERGDTHFPSQTTAILWNKVSLNRAAQLLESYDKFTRDRLPLLPSGLRNSVRDIAHTGLQAAVLTAVADAQSPMNTGSTPDASSLIIEIRSFEEALPMLTQIGASLSSVSAGTRADLNVMLTHQATTLSQQLNTLFQSDSFYAPQPNLAAWDGVKPLSLSDYGVDNPDELELYLAKQRDLLKAVALDYALPLQQYLQSRRIETPEGLGVWPKVIKDVQDYDAKKPGNSVSALETFIRTDLDKINTANACATVGTPARTADYFVAVRAKLQTEAVKRCGELLMSRYSDNIATFFNSKLAGKFPFGPVPKSSDAPEASANDVVKFLDEIEQAGPAVSSYLRANHLNPEIVTFLAEADAVRQLFSGGLKDGALWLDAKVLFRANRQAEIAADHLIAWSLQTGDSQAGAGTANNGVRWNPGTPAVLTVRFANDSPDVPVAGGAGPDARVDGRTVRYEYLDSWSLLKLLQAHSNSNADYGVASGMSPGTLRLTIPTAPDTARAKAQAAQQAQGEVRVFFRLTFQVPGGGVGGAVGGKESRDVALPVFPEIAPVVRSSIPFPSSN